MCQLRKATRLSLPFVFALLLTSIPVLVASESPNTTLIGVAKIDITPETPVRMYGYASRKTESEGIAGPLKASALVMGSDKGRGPAVMLAVDCGSVPQDIIETLLQRLTSKAGIRRQRFVLCHSHCHSGPNLTGMTSMEGIQKEHLQQYADLLLDRMETVVLKALAQRTEARLAWTQGTTAVAANRRILTDGKWTGFGAVPEGAVDHSLPLLRITDTHGKLLGVVINYACHNTTLRNRFMQIHGDWAACAQAYIEKAHPGAVCLITIGCGADSDPCPHGTVALCEQHGRTIADEVDRLLTGPFKPIPGQIRIKNQTIPFSQNETEPYDYRIATWCFGRDLAMVFLEHEVVVDYALRMKQEFAGERLWINAYTNKVSTYIASKRLITEGGYEANNSLSAKLSPGKPQAVSPTVEDRIVNAVGKMLPKAFH